MILFITTRKAFSNMFWRLFLALNMYVAVLFMGNYYQVLYSVIGCIFIDMMYYFTFIQYSPKLFFHHQPMFTYITPPNFIRMVRAINIDISTSNQSSALPPRAKFSSVCLTPTFKGTEFTASYFKLGRRNIENRMTHSAFLSDWRVSVFTLFHENNYRLRRNQCQYI